MASKRKKGRTPYRLYLKETGEHYTIRLSRDAYDKLSDKEIKKYSKKLRKHAKFKVIKKVK